MIPLSLALPSYTGNWNFFFKTSENLYKVDPESQVGNYKTLLSTRI